MTKYKCSCCTLTEGCILESDKNGEIFCRLGRHNKIPIERKKTRRYLKEIFEKEEVKFT